MTKPLLKNRRELTNYLHNSKMAFMRKNMDCIVSVLINIIESVEI